MSVPDGLLSEGQLTHDKSRLRPGLKLDPMESPVITLSDNEVDCMIAETVAMNQDTRAPSNPRAQRRARAEDAAINASVEACAWAASASANEKTIAPPRRRPSGRAKLRALGIAAVLGTVFIWPWAIPLVLLGLVWLALVLFIFVGGERLYVAFAAVYRWLNRLAPERAERFRVRLDGLALRCDALLDRLPGRWTDGVHLPDFSREAMNDPSETDWPEPFERIAAEVRRG